MVRASDSILFIGCGTPSGGDDGIAQTLTMRLATEHAGRTNVRFDSVGTPDVDLFELFDTEDHIVFLDAVTSGREPGSIVIAPLPCSGISQRCAVGGGDGAAGLLALARSLGRRLPRTTLVGIEVSGDAAETASPLVVQSANWIAEHFDELQHLLAAREMIVLPATFDQEGEVACMS